MEESIEKSRGYARELGTWEGGTNEITQGERPIKERGEVDKEGVRTTRKG